MPAIGGWVPGKWPLRFPHVNTGEGLDRGWPVFDWPANAAVVRAIHISAMKRRLLEAIA